MLVGPALVQAVANGPSSAIDLLATLRVQAARGGQRELAERSACGSPAASSIWFCTVLVGACSFHGEGGARVALSRGDLIAILQAGHNVLSPEVSLGATATVGAAQARSKAAAVAVERGGATLFAGELEVDPVSHALLVRLLPGWVVVSAESSSVALSSTLSALAFACSSSALGARALASRLGDALVLQVIQSHLARHGAAPALLRACSDPQIGRAMALIHRSPEHPWTVDALAARASMSRSAFRTRFASLVGEPPARYLTRWRIRTAIDRLCRSNAPLRDIAACVGYESEAAFSKVFKRWTGSAPGAYRQRAQASSTAATTADTRLMP